MTTVSCTQPFRGEAIDRSRRPRRSLADAGGAKAPPATPAGPNVESDVVSKIQRMRCRILVVDDEDRFRASFAFKLKRIYGAVVEEASGGVAALEKVGEQPGFHLILLDVSMPGMDGIEVCERMRASGITSRIVLMSAHDNIADRTNATALGVRLLSKPLREDELRQVLLECVEDKT